MPLVPQLPASVLGPLGVPTKVPPSGAITATA
jgi:hypothetical protein